MPDNRPRSSIYAGLPNAITGARLVSTPVLVALSVQQQAALFSILLVLALASDLVDGWVARRWGLVSRAGALLDSIADMALTLAILFSIWFLHPEVYRQDGWVIYSLMIAWLVAHCASLLRYGRLASFHTWLIRIGIALFNFFAVVLFVLGYYPGLLYVSALMSLLGVIEHFILLALLPRWSPDLPGGIPQALRRRQELKAPEHQSKDRNSA